MPNKLFNNISGLQLFSFLKFTSFLVISIVLTKSHFTRGEIGEFEALLFVSNVVAFFWMTGLIQSFLPLYNNNAAFPGSKISRTHKSPEIFNVFLLISIFSIVIFILGHILKNQVYFFSHARKIEHANILLLYILLSNPAHLVEYIYLLRNRSSAIVNYGVITYSLQLVFVLVPVYMGKGVYEAILGLVLISVIRVIWLGSLLVKYSEFKISWKFMGAHLKLGYPLIISTLLTGSAQYIDGLVAANKFDNAQFALFRYGAKELPFLVMLVSGLHNALLPEFSFKDKFQQTLTKLKIKSFRTMNIVFPVSIVLLFLSDYIFPHLFNPEFARSSDVFMVYLLMVLNRVLMPQTILIGLKKTTFIMALSVFMLLINVGLSLFLIRYYGLVGIALATVLLYTLEKIILIFYVWKTLKIAPNKYIPLIPYTIHSIILLIIFILIDHRIINIF